MDYTANGQCSERDVVFHVVEFPGGVLGGRFRFTLPSRGLGLLLAARLVLPRIGGGDADVGHRLAARQIARFRIPAEVADDDHFVYRCHDCSLSSILYEYTTPGRAAG